MPRKKIIFIFGPSGVGKSTLSRQLAAINSTQYCIVEDSAELLNSVILWQIDLKTTLEHSSFTSTTLAECIDKLHQTMKDTSAPIVIIEVQTTIHPNPELIDTLKELGVFTIILYASANHCRKSFLRREKLSGRNYSLQHWENHNQQVYKLNDHCLAPWRVNTTEDNLWRPMEHILIDAINKMSCKSLVFPKQLPQSFSMESSIY